MPYFQLVSYTLSIKQSSTESENSGHPKNYEDLEKQQKSFNIFQYIWLDLDKMQLKIHCNIFLPHEIVLASFSFAWKVCIHSMYPKYQNFCLGGIFGLLLMQYYLDMM